MTECVIFDIDGTLADVRHRLHFVSDGRKDWVGFFRMMEDDPVHEPVARLLRLVHKEMPVLLCSGRPDDYREATARWLNEHDIPYARLYMRAKGDYRQDAIVKRQILAGIREDGYEPILVIDDRQQVVDMWRDEGLMCLQVAADEEKDAPPPGVEGKTLLTVMVGPSGGGKSTWVKLHCDPHTVLSSDQIRTDLCGSFKDQSQNDRVFAALHHVATARLKNGLPVVIDATNLRRKDRLACVALAPKGTRVRYVVVDRPMPDKLRDGGWRLEVAGLLDKHQQTFNSQIKDILRGDDLAHVDVVDLRSTVCSP